jgi:hypothetical protein
MTDMSNGRTAVIMIAGLAIGSLQECFQANGYLMRSSGRCIRIPVTFGRI